MNDFFYKKLEAYRMAKEFTIYVYSLLKKFPLYEQYALSDQLRRASVSIPSNIAEGMGRVAIKERLHFLEISYGSVMEVMCQLDISHSLGYIDEHDLENAESLASTLTKVMSGLRKSLSEKLNCKTEEKV
jgi:four helix bundle protein